MGLKSITFFKRSSIYKGEYLMNMKVIKDVRINVKLSRDERKMFKEHCIDNGFGISKRIRELIKMDTEGKICQKD